MERALLDVASSRLQTVSRELVSLFATSTEQRLSEARRLAALPAVAALRDRPDESTRHAARHDFEAFLKTSPQTVGLELWSPAGERLLDVVPTRPAGTTAALPPARTRMPTAAGFSPLLAFQHLAYYELAMPLPMPGTPDVEPGRGAIPRSSGYLVVRRRVSTAGAADTLRTLLGDGVALYVGSNPGTWTDFSRVTPAPPVGTSAPGVTEYRDDHGDAQLGAGAAIARTPWRLWVAIPRRVALAPAALFLQRIIPFSILVVFLGSLIAWIAARQITKPLNDLTAAAEAIAGGDLSRRVTVQGRDELGRLAHAFNAMTIRVKDGYERLDARVSERTHDLEQTMAQLKETQEELVRREKLAMLGQLASGVGHELRNPLGVMTNALYFLEMVQPDAPPEVKEYHALVRAQIGLSERIVNDLLDFARIKPPRREPLPLARLVDDQLTRLPAMDGIRVQCDIAPDLPEADVDPVQIGQVLLNLFVNAVQAMEGHGGTLTVRGRVHEDGVCLDVIDTGPGVPADIQHKIFDALFTTKARGIGLGLAVSRSLAEANDGRLSLVSRPGEGATFTLTMPAVRVLETTR